MVKIFIKSPKAFLWILGFDLRGWSIRLYIAKERRPKK